MKSTILHIIDSFGLGGAEKLLAGYINNNDEFNHRIITLWNEIVQVDEANSFDHICLNYKSKLDIPRCIYTVRKLIKEHQIEIVHSHLLTSTLIARMSVSKHQRLVYTTHNILSESAFSLSRTSWLLEKLLLRKKDIGIFVSETARKDYVEQIGLPTDTYVLYNFIDDHFFQLPVKPLKRGLHSTLKFISVGSLKSQKNYEFLIRVFAGLDSNRYQLDIYGEGPLEKQLKKLTNELNTSNVNFKGVSLQIENVLPNYDFYISGSNFEGFGISVLEAMAAGIPAILPSIEIFKEITEGHSILYPPNKVNDTIEILANIGNFDIGKLTELAKKRAFNIASFEQYDRKLSDIYRKYL